MAHILTKEETDLLMGSAQDLRRERTREDGTQPSSTPFDFRRPDRVSKHQVRSLQLLHDRFARNVSASLSAFLRTVTEVSIVSVEQCTYAEFLMSLPDPTAFYAIATSPIEGLAALELNPSVAFTMIDRMLGGQGRDVRLTRALTEIEQNVVDGIVKLILENLADSWHTNRDVHFRISARETRPQMLRVAAPSDAVLMLGFDVRISDVLGRLNICLPASIVEAAGDPFSQHWFRASRPPTPAQRRRFAMAIGRARFPVTAMLDVALPARELLRLQPGDVLSLGKPASHPVHIRVGSTTKYAGRLIQIDSRVGVAISDGPLAAGVATHGG